MKIVQIFIHGETVMCLTADGRIWQKTFAPTTFTNDPAEAQQDPDPGEWVESLWNRAKFNT